MKANVGWTFMSTITRVHNLPEYVGWTFMYRLCGIPQAQGGAGAAISTSSLNGLDKVDMNVHPTRKQ